MLVKGTLVTAFYLENESSCLLIELVLNKQF